jgi:hypothetical protein
VSEDIQKEPIGRQKPEPLIDDSDAQDLVYSEEPPYPSVVTAAGVLWITFGCLTILGMAMSFLSAVIVAANKGGQAGAGAISGAACGSIIGGLIAFLFIRVGIQNVRGAARDTLGNGIGSILFALLPLAVAAYFASRGEFIEAGIEGMVAAILLAAGILALAGRSQYKVWRKPQLARQKRDAREIVGAFDEWRQSQKAHQDEHVRGSEADHRSGES